MLRGIIFDFDGVVVDTHPAHKQAWKSLLGSLGKQVSDDDLQVVLEGQKREEILRHFLGPLAPEQVKDYGERKEALFKEAAQGITTVRGLPDFLSRVVTAGFSRALASAASRVRVQYLLQRLNLESRFQAVVTGEDVEHGKPDPALFLLAAARMNLPAGGILVCEDAVNGVAAAKAAGMKCLAIAPNGRAALLHKAGADKVISDFSQADLDELCRMFV